MSRLSALLNYKWTHYFGYSWTYYCGSLKYDPNVNSTQWLASFVCFLCKSIAEANISWGKTTSLRPEDEGPGVLWVMRALMPALVYRLFLWGSWRIGNSIVDTPFFREQCFRQGFCDLVEKMARNWGDRKKGRIGFKSQVQPGAAQIDLVPAVSLVKQAGSFIFVA